MKIICEKEKIIKALNSVTKAVASKPNILLIVKLKKKEL